MLPILREDVGPPAYEMFGAAASAGSITITEVSESGVFAQLQAVNVGARPVLLLDGEEVTGAKQNRIVNLTVLVDAVTVVELPVSCVEQGRWSMQSRAFSEAIAAIVGAAVGALHGRSALPRRWLDGLLGRIAADYDGTVFRLMEEAGAAFIRL